MDIYNITGLEEATFTVTVSQTLSRKTDLTTDDYNLERYGDEVLFDTSEVDWKELYRAQENTPIELINILKEYLELDLEKGITKRDSYVLRNLINNCNDWVEDDFEVVE